MLGFFLFLCLFFEGGEKVLVNVSLAANKKKHEIALLTYSSFNESLRSAQNNTGANLTSPATFPNTSNKTGRSGAENGDESHSWFTVPSSVLLI